MFRPILIPVDGSPCGDQAAELGLLVAERLGTAVRLIHVRNTGSQPPYGEGEREWRELEGGGLALLQRWELAANLRGLQATMHSVEGSHVARAIAHTARSTGCSFIAMGAHCGYRWRQLLMPSMAEAVVSLAPIPVMTLQCDGKGSLPAGAWRFGRVLAPVDGSVLSLRTLEWVREFAQALEAEVTVL
jgi:nucleotide-binding universal stress UspA family protein